MMFILKSRINESITNARNQERKLQEKEWKRKLDRALSEQRDLFELQVREKELQIETLEGIIEYNKSKMDEAADKEMQSNRIFLKAKELIAQVDLEYRRQLENQARSSVIMNKIRDESEKFSKQIINK